MTHNKVYEQFKKLLPVYAKYTMEWFPNGLNSIRIRQIDEKDFIFTINDDLNDIRFETKDAFIKRIVGGGAVMKC